MPAIAQLSVLAISLKPGGNSVTLSPWLIQTCMLQVWMSHGDKVTELPPGFKLMASTDSCAIAGMADEERRFYGVQFHPEVTHTKRGAAILDRFVLDICAARPAWIMGDYVSEAVAQIRAQVGTEEVILGLSGGVD